MWTILVIVLYSIGTSGAAAAINSVGSYATEIECQAVAARISESYSRPLGGNNVKTFCVKK